MEAPVMAIGPRSVSAFDSACALVRDALAEAKTDRGAVLEGPVVEALGIVAGDPPEWARVEEELRRLRLLKNVRDAISRQNRRGARTELVPPPETYSGLLDIIRGDSRILDGALEWNEMLGMATIGRQEIQEHITAVIRERIERNIWANGKPLVFDFGWIERALEQVAHELAYNPLRSYLEGLTWDGVPRLDALLEEYLGCEKPKPIERTVLRRWLVSAVARALEPGCQADHVLIAYSPQGRGKTSAFRALGCEWFSEDTIDLGDKDTLILLRRVWILEWGELDALRRSETTKAKGFITRRQDIFRPPYGRRSVTAPRHCVFVGTTNDEDFLVDPSGNRRYWVIRVGVDGPILVEKLSADRDQIWAEVVARYRTSEAAEHQRVGSPGERWWLEGDEIPAMEDAQGDFERSETAESEMLAWAERRAGSFTTADLLLGALDLKLAQITRSHEMAASNALKRAGYRHPKVTRGGIRAKRWMRKGMTDFGLF